MEMGMWHSEKRRIFCAYSEKSYFIYAFLKMEKSYYYFLEYEFQICALFFKTCT